MVFASWRGVVGVIKPTHRPGSLEEFIRLLPEGIGVVPLYLNFKRGTEDEFRAALNAIEQKVAELANEGVMVFSSWRGVVGVIKPTHRPCSLEEFIRLLPEGIGG